MTFWCGGLGNRKQRLNAALVSVCGPCSYEHIVLGMPNYRIPTGELLRSLRPATYRQIVDLLAEPREHVSYREIARVCKVGGGTIKAIERAESATIAERKAKMLQQVTRVAERAWRTVEDKLDGANLAQATICAGIATEKMLLLNSDPALQTLQISLEPIDVITPFKAMVDKLTASLARPPQPALPCREVVVSNSMPATGP